MNNIHCGHKLTHTSRLYNVTANHHCLILSSTSSHPVTYNDKLLAYFDPSMKRINDGTLYSGIKFNLWEVNCSNKDLYHQLYRWCWLIVDNGYHWWPISIPQVKVSGDQRVLRWLEWIESIRKDIECRFGILKGLYVSLKLVFVHTEQKVVMWSFLNTVICITCFLIMIDLTNNWMKEYCTINSIHNRVCTLAKWENLIMMTQ